MLEAFLRKSWQTTFSEGFGCAETEYFVCQNKFGRFGTEIGKKQNGRQKKLKTPITSEWKVIKPQYLRQILCFRCLPTH